MLVLGLVEPMGFWKTLTATVRCKAGAKTGKNFLFRFIRTVWWKINDDISGKAYRGDAQKTQGMGEYYPAQLPMTRRGVSKLPTRFQLDMHHKIGTINERAFEMTEMADDDIVRTGG
jgi:hypothetical protein